MDDDRELVRSCIAGEAGAWDAFLKGYERLIAHVARSAIASYGVPCDEGDLGDIAQEVLADLLADGARLLREFRFESSLATWLALVVRTHARRWALRRRGERPLSEGLAPSRPSGEPADEAATTEIGRCLDQLSERERRIVLLFYVERRKYRQIAESEGLPVNSVASIIFRAKEKMRRALLRPSSTGGEA